MIRRKEEAVVGERAGREGEGTGMGCGGRDGRRRQPGGEEEKRTWLGRRKRMLVDITVTVSGVLEAYILPISIYHSHQHHPACPGARRAGPAPPPRLDAPGDFNLSPCIAVTSGQICGGA